MSKVFVDTNILVYLFDASEPDKQQQASKLLQTTDYSLVVSTQVLLELFTVLTRKLKPPMPHATAAQAIEQLSQLPVVTADAALVNHAIATAGRHQLSIWDAMVVEAATLAGCMQLWSEDLAAGAHLRGVQIINPLNPSPA